MYCSEMHWAVELIHCNIAQVSVLKRKPFSISLKKFVEEVMAVIYGKAGHVRDK